jgi:hypothetical protein
MNFWISLVGYQAVWFCAVIGAGHGWAWPGMLGFVVYACWQFGISRHRRGDLQLVLTAIALGCVLDGVALRIGLLHYAAPWPSATLPPAWILALWATFALTFNQSLAYLQTRPWVAWVLGAVGGPLAYLGAARGWHVVAFASPVWPALLWLCAGWGIATPLLAGLAKRWSHGATPASVSLPGHTS